jgi:hypothetical protein
MATLTQLSEEVQKLNVGDGNKYGLMMFDQCFAVCVPAHPTSRYPSIVYLERDSVEGRGQLSELLPFFPDNTRIVPTELEQLGRILFDGNF